MISAVIDIQYCLLPTVHVPVPQVAARSAWLCVGARDQGRAEEMEYKHVLLLLDMQRQLSASRHQSHNLFVPTNSVYQHIPSQTSPLSCAVLSSRSSSLESAIGHYSSVNAAVDLSATNRCKLEYLLTRARALFTTKPLMS